MSNTVREGIFWAKSGTAESQTDRDRRGPARGQTSSAAVAVLEAPETPAPDVKTSGVTPPRRDDTTK